MGKTLVAGIGNIFLGDDAFGVEVVRRLIERGVPAGVDAVDFGIRGIDLAYTLQDAVYDSVILVDACPRGKEPGTVFVLEPSGGNAPRGAAAFLSDGHGLDPAKVLAWAEALGVRPPRLRVVGCEPSPGLELEEMSTGMSEPVARAVPRAVDLVVRLIEEEAACTSSP